MAELLSGVALVTGAGSGIGQATAVAFARHGVEKLALLEVNKTGLETTRSLINEIDTLGEVINLQVDVSDESSVVQAIQDVIARFKRIDIAFNNAGIGGPVKLSTEISAEEYRRTVDVNMTGLWLSQREEIKQMFCQEPVEIRPKVLSRGVIVNMSSIFGLTGAPSAAPAAPYNTSKHGVMAITKNDANSFAKDGIRINAICPGYVKTNHMADTVADSEIIRQEIAKIPMGRLASTEEIADAVIFLASSMSSFINGAALVVDGGYTSN